jgi:hypothetical protein
MRDRRQRIEIRFDSGRVVQAKSLEEARRLIGGSGEDVAEVWLVWPNDLAGGQPVKFEGSEALRGSAEATG